MQIPLACIEIGGGSVQTVLFSDGVAPELIAGAAQPDGARLAVAVPGVIADGMVVEASNLGWRNTDPVSELGVSGPASLVWNDGEAAALGEAALRGAEGLAHLVYVCIGTGVGGAVVRDAKVERTNLFGHNEDGYGVPFGDRLCRCGRAGCLETVAAGWALPDPLTDQDVIDVGTYVARAIVEHPMAGEGTVVIGGGIAARYPQVIDRIRTELGSRDVEPTKAPAGAKSAAAWGLRYALRHQG